MASTWPAATPEACDHRATPAAVVAVLTGTAAAVTFAYLQQPDVVLALVGPGCYVAAWVTVIRTTRRRGVPGIGILLVGLWTAYYGLLVAIPTDTRRGTSAELYRLLNTDQISRWLVVAAVSALTLSVGHRLALRLLGPPRPPAAAMQLPSPWLLTVIAAPLLGVLMSRGGAVDHDGYAQAGLAVQFAPQLVVLAAVAHGIRRPRKLALIVGLACLAIALFGQRLEIVVAAISIVGAWRWLGLRIPRRQFTTLAVVLVLLVLALTAARQVVGRDSLKGETSTSTRVESLGTGLGEAGRSTSVIGQSLVEARSRIEGNAFPALVLGAQSRVGWRAGLTPYANGLRLAVPSFLWPGKMDRSLEARSERTLLVNHYHLPLTGDFLPTWGGSLVASFGAIGLPVAAFVVGAAAGVVDGALRVRTTARLLLGITAVSTIGYFERDLSESIINARGLLLLVVVVAGLRRVENVLRGRRMGINPVAVAAIE